MFTYFTDRDGKFQLCALAESSFDPLARTTKFMLTEEAHHMFVGESGVGRVIQRTCEAMNELKTDDPAKLRAAGVIDLPTIQRYLNFHFSVTIDLFGADQSSNAATFYSHGPEGPLRRGKRTTTTCSRATYKMLERANGQLVEKEVPMLNALNEVLRDDYIKDSSAASSAGTSLIEKAGIPFRLTVPHKAFHRNIGTLAGVKVAPDGRVVSEAGMERQGRPVAAHRRGPRLRRQPDGPRGRARQVRQLDRAAGHGHQPPAGGFRVRAVQLNGRLSTSFDR
jgi:benzoyl-CoA 2,3-dioxygenase component B